MSGVRGLTGAGADPTLSEASRLSDRNLRRHSPRATSENRLIPRRLSSRANASYNGAVSEGGCVTFGCNASWSGSNPVPRVTLG